MAENPIEIEFTYTRDMAARASVEMTHAVMPFMRLMPVIGVCVIAAQFVFTQGVALVFPLFVGLMLCGMPLITRWGAVRTFTRLPQANKVIRWVIGPETLSIESPLGTSQFVWAGIIRTRETKHGILLFTHPRSGCPAVPSSPPTTWSACAAGYERAAFPHASRAWEA